MIKLSTGDDSTLGNYRKLAAALFGEYSKPVNFIDDKIAHSPSRNTDDISVKYNGI